MTRNRTNHSNATPCPDCGVPLRPLPKVLPDTYPADGPLRRLTPFERLSALAAQAAIDVFDIPAEDSDGLAGAIAVAFDEQGQLRTTIGLTDNLDDDLRTDVLAFGMAVSVDDAERIMQRPSGSVGIRAPRLRSAREGAGHLAWHMVFSCGRATSSATFALEALD